jgi:uncharacterized protein involved in exopolysaccharide biosynthesis
MTNTGLPDPGIGRNPPRYRKLIPPNWATRHLVITAVAAFVAVGGIYYFFAV